MTSTVDKPYGARRTVPYKNLVLSGEKPAALELNGDGVGEQENGSGTSARKLHGGIPATGSASRLDHLSTKSGIPGSKSLSHAEHGGLTSVSQPNLHRIPGRSKSESRLGHKDPRKDSASTDPSESPGKTSGLPKRMLRLPSAGILTGRSTPVEPNTSGRTTPSKLTRPGSRLTKLSGSTSSEHKVAGKDSPQEEGEPEPLKFERKRSNSEVRRSPAANAPRSASRSAGESHGIPVLGGGLAFGGKGHQKSSPVNPDSRLLSPSSVPPGDGGLRQLKPPSDMERSSTSTEPGSTTVRSDTAKRIGGSGLQAPTQRIMRTQSPNSSPSSSLNRKTDTRLLEEHETSSVAPSTDGSAGGREKSESSGKDRPSSVTSKKLSKATSLQQFRSGIPSAGDVRKSPNHTSGLSKLQSLASSQGFVPTNARGGSRSPRGDSMGKERAAKGGGKKERRSSNSSLESSTNSEHDIRPAMSAHLEKQVSSASSTGSSTQTESEKTNVAPPTSQNALVTPLVGGKDNRRISPEGMSPDGKTLSNESINENQKNSMNRQVTTPKFIEQIAQSKEGDGDGLKVRDKGDVMEKMGGTVEVSVVDESETQTPNLSQGSEVATDSTLSSLSLASASSPPHNSHSSLLTSSTDACGQQPETGQAPYSVATSPREKHSSSPHRISHDSHVTVNEGDTATATQAPPEARHFIPAHMRPPQQVNHPLRSPLKKEKAKRARSLSPKSSRRIFPLPPQPSGPAVNVSHYDAANNANVVPPPSTSERLAHLELSRTDSPESVKSDVVASAYSSARKPLRSSLRTSKDKDSSSSSLDSGKVNMLGTKVTISPRSSQVVFLPDEVGLHLSATFSQPTNLTSPNRRLRGRPSSLSDSHRVDPDAEKRVSIVSEKLDYSDEEKFLATNLGHNSSHQRYDSTPEVHCMCTLMCVI